MQVQSLFAIQEKQRPDQVAADETGAAGDQEGLPPQVLPGEGPEGGEGPEIFELNAVHGQALSQIPKICEFSRTSTRARKI